MNLTKPDKNLDKIIAFEQGDLSNYDAIHLFADLIRTGQAWTLQGMYGRTARSMISKGLISEDGNVLADIINPETCAHENLSVSDHRLVCVEDEEYVIIEFDYICADCGKHTSTVKTRYAFDKVMEIE